jgi:hypothetical protein
MAVGDLLKTEMHVTEQFTVKENEDIEKGELVCDDGSGNGLVAATATLAVTQKVMMALEAHDYSEEDYHVIPCVVVGQVDCQKISGSGATKKNDKIMVSATAGECTKFVKGDAPTGGVNTYYTTTIETNVQAAMDKNLGIIGTALEDTTNSDTTQKMFLGVY